MDGCEKRLGIALTVVALVLGMNVLAVVTGAADGAYERLLGYDSAHRLAARDSNPATLMRLSKGVECPQSRPKPMRPEGALLPVKVVSGPRVSARMC